MGSSHLKTLSSHFRLEQNRGDRQDKATCRRCSCNFISEGWALACFWLYVIWRGLGLHWRGCVETRKSLVQARGGPWASQVTSEG